MSIKALGIFLPQGRRIGVLFQYDLGTGAVTTRFVADAPFAQDPQAPLLGQMFVAQSPDEQAALWANVTATLMNGRRSSNGDWQLPAFFQNLLPEGVFRDHIAQLRKCAPTDHFEMLAACGKDLPGALYALPVTLSEAEKSRLVTQNQDAVEVAIVQQPLEQGLSLSGVQPKVGVRLEDGRYVARTKTQDAHIIAKLPVAARQGLPEVEELSLRLAQAAGVRVCRAHLAALRLLGVEHGYDLGDAQLKTLFLAVERFDRSASGRIHCEDFAQVLGVMPQDKYGKEEGLTYLSVATVLLNIPELGEPAVHELLRRLVVNEMLGNPDMHLKNLGLRYPDGRMAEFSPAYDVVAYACYQGVHGHALRLVPERKDAPWTQGQQQLSPALLRDFCEQLNIVERPAAAVVRDAVARAAKSWPELIEQSRLSKAQKRRLSAHFEAHPLVQSLQRRKSASDTQPSSSGR